MPLKSVPFKGHSAGQFEHCQCSCLTLLSGSSAALLVLVALEIGLQEAKCESW